MFLAEIQGFLHHFLTSIGIIPTERFVSPTRGRRPFVVSGAIDALKTRRFFAFEAEERAEPPIKMRWDEEILGEFS
jgi:hypothetical protein